MSTTIYVPKKIKVGFNKRSDTYTGKLAYVIYYDEKGKLRKEKSWESWRNVDIDPEEYSNEPTSGFVLNKKVGDYSGDWGAHRQAYCRIYDPRGFEFEISINNLLFILEHCTCNPGKGLEGDFVYGWDGKDLVLLPTKSPDYIEIEEYSKRINERQTFKGKDLIIGATYLTKDNEKWVYMGRFDKWDCRSSYYYGNRYSFYRNGWDERDVDDSWIKDPYTNHAYKNENKGKHYWFICPDVEWEYKRIKTFKSLSSKIIDVIDGKCVQNYVDLYAELEKKSSFSPIDYSKDEVYDMDYESFEERCNYVKDRAYGKYIDLYSKAYSKIITLRYDNYYHGRSNTEEKWIIPDKQVFNTLKEAYESIQPLERKRYLSNGNVYEIGW